jgi:wyosine [tRNA(Phe)-imidazoG37] synthetase (radical SAM superfamily)
MEAEPRLFYRTAMIAEQARTKLERARQKGEPINYVTFVPDGEPTLDADVGKEIEMVKALGVKVAVITNGSLLWHEVVRQNLLKADWVSVKVDAVSEETWRRIDRPHQSLKLGAILEGMLKFAETFEGEVTTETMLVRGVNDDLGEIKEIAQFLAEFKPQKAYVAIPTRPPAERVEPASEQTINTAYQVFAERLSGVEYLIGYEGNAFACTGNVQEDLLSITSVHPMREEAVAEFLENAGTGWETVQHLIEKRDLVELEYQGKKFYMRRLPAHSVPRS